MAEAGTLAYFDKCASTKVVADASPVSLGAMLMQNQNGAWVLICYASCSLTADGERDPCPRLGMREPPWSSCSVVKSESSSASGSSASSPDVHSALRIKPENFSGGSGKNWLAWLRKFESIVALNKWNQELQCQIFEAYPDDPPEILSRTARDFFVGALTPISLRENVLDLGPNSLDEVLAAAQRYESNQKVLEKGSAQVLTRSSEEEEGASSASYSAFQTTLNPGSQQGTQKPQPWAREFFEQQAEILQKLKNIPHGGQESRAGRREGVESIQGPRACFKCGSLTHLIRDCPSQSIPFQGNLRRAGRNQK
ncbi:hypothetical protein ACROYT_G022480 [Oculina patagonica]